MAQAGPAASKSEREMKINMMKIDIIHTYYYYVVHLICTKVGSSNPAVIQVVSIDYV